MTKGGKMSHNILVVDGSNLARTILRGYLKKELPEAKVDTAATGEEAVRFLEAASECYHLITTALLLPDIDGLDLSRAVRTRSKHRHAPVVVVSSDADERLVREGFRAGVTEYFDKSQGLEALGAFIKEFVSRSPGYVGRVLYVEDSKTASAWGCKVMERHGLQVEHLASAEAAMQRLTQDSETPDVVVTDYFLSGKATGEDLLRFIRRNRRLSPQELPVLVVTGGSDSNRHAEVLHRGANDFIEKPTVEEILMARIRSLLLVKQTFDALQRQSEMMRQMAFTDSLTGVRNKRYLLEKGDGFLARYAPVALLITDVDHFKRINDTHGHLTGDKILASTGNLLRRLFPETDGHMVCRFGGEEFVIVSPRTTEADALAAGERLRRELSELKPEGIPLTASVGVVGSESHGDKNLSQLLALADQALYEGKSRGRNCVYYAGPAGPERASA